MLFLKLVGAFADVDIGMSVNDQNKQVCGFFQKLWVIMAGKKRDKGHPYW